MGSLRIFAGLLQCHQPHAAWIELVGALCWKSMTPTKAEPGGSRGHGGDNTGRLLKP
jgi:hypothetical protein